MSPEERAEIEKQYGAPIVECCDNDIVTVTVSIRAVTDGAVKVAQRVAGAFEKQQLRTWLPRKFVEPKEIAPGGPVDIRIPLWLAKKRRLRFAVSEKEKETP